MIGGTLETGAIIVIILAVLPYIAIIGTWTEISRMRKNIETELEETNRILEVLTKATLEIKERQKMRNIDVAGFQPAESETEQNRPNV